MDPRHLRSSSPGSRRLHQPGRSSTGTIIYPQDYDPYYAPTRSSRESISGPRSSADRLLAPNTIVRQYRVDGGSARRVDDYPISPRRATLDPLAAAGRRPLSIAPVSSPDRYRPVISSAKEQPSGSFKSRPRDEEPHYLLPASSALSRRDHHRTYSVDNPSEAGRYLSDGRDRHERAGYRSSGVGGRRQGYNLNQPLVRQPKDDDDEDLGYEYTDRKEQMYRDTAPRPRPRRTSDGGRRERPLSMTGLEDYPSRLLQASRDGRPPVTTRGFDKLDRSGSLRHEYRIPREPDPLPRDRVPLSDTEDQRKHRSSHSSRAPVSLHQERDAGPVDDGYSSYREDRKDHRDRHGHGSRRAGSLDRRANDQGLGAQISPEDDRRRGSNDKSGRHHEPDPRKDRGDLVDRDRHHRTTHRSDHGENEELGRRTHDEPRKDKQEKSKAEDWTMAAAGLGATALVAEGVKERKHRKKDSADPDPEMPLPDRTRNHGDDRLAVVPDPDESGGRNGDPTDEERRERRRRRRREKEQQEEDVRLADRAVRRHEALVPPVDESRRDSGSYERDSRHPPPTVPQANEPPKSHREHHHRHHDEESYSDNSSEDERRNSHTRKTSQVRVVSPAKDEKPEPKPKGILRPPREKFPEDPAPVREGVAPLKDAGKKGIPPNARWTKIDRRLVNPEALDQGNERYEERIEYVIVLRVLTKEEIQAYAKRTQEIRGKRTPLAVEEGSVAADLSK